MACKCGRTATLLDGRCAYCHAWPGNDIACRASSIDPADMLREPPAPDPSAARIADLEAALRHIDATAHNCMSGLDKVRMIEGLEWIKDKVKNTLKEGKDGK